MKALVIGGGIIGGSVAWRLAAEGIKVTVLERGQVGQEASWAAAGMIAPQAEAEGPGPFLDLCLKGREAFDLIVDRLRHDSGVDPEYDAPGILYVALDERERAELEGRARWQRKLGLKIGELTGAQARRIEPKLTPQAIYALHLPDNRRIDNRKLTQAYLSAAMRAGAELRQGALVEAIVARNAHATGVRLGDGSVEEADVIVNAAGSWAGTIRGLEADAVRLRPIRGQIICFQGRPDLLGWAIFSLRGYLVPRRDGRLLAGSTMEEAGFDKSVTMAGIGRIVSGANALVPELASLPFREAWAGFRPATDDTLPVLGPSPALANVFYAAGHYRSGILLSALTGEIIADLVKGRTPPIDLAPFSAARFSARSSNRMSAPTRVLGLVRDLFFRSKLDVLAGQLGVELSYASNLDEAGARLAGYAPEVVLVDLSDGSFPADATAAAIREAAPGARLVGFASHVDLKALKGAREAGFSLTLSRSEFTARLPELLKG